MPLQYQISIFLPPRLTKKKKGLARKLVEGDCAIYFMDLGESGQKVTWCKSSVWKKRVGGSGRKGEGGVA